MSYYVDDDGDLEILIDEYHKAFYHVGYVTLKELKAAYEAAGYKVSIEKEIKDERKEV